MSIAYLSLYLFQFWLGIELDYSCGIYDGAKGGKNTSNVNLTKVSLSYHQRLVKLSVKILLTCQALEVVVLHLLIPQSQL